MRLLAKARLRDSQGAAPVASRRYRKRGDPDFVMVARSFQIRLSDIREEIAGIRDLTKDANAEIFAANWGMKRAVEHALLIIAEAAKHIPANLKASRPPQ
jgi:hypothetical protein